MTVIWPVLKYFQSSRTVPVFLKNFPPGCSQKLNKNAASKAWRIKVERNQLNACA
jgi:hypothetical protein